METDMRMWGHDGDIPLRGRWKSRGMRGQKDGEREKEREFWRCLGAERNTKTSLFFLLWCLEQKKRFIQAEENDLFLGKQDNCYDFGCVGWAITNVWSPVKGLGGWPCKVLVTLPYLVSHRPLFPTSEGSHLVDSHKFWSQPSQSQSWNCRVCG